MTRLIAVGVASLLLAAPASAECTKEDRAALIDFDQAWGKATRSGDRATLERVLADDYMALGAVTVNKAQAIANAVRNAELARASQVTSDFREDYYQINCSAAEATIAHRTVSTTSSGVAYGRSIHVVEKRNGRWQAVTNTAHPLNDQAIVGYLEYEWNDAIRTKDTAWLERNLAAEYLGAASTSGTAVVTKAQEISNMRTGPAYESVEFEELVVRVSGDTAIVSGINRLKGRDAQGQAVDNRVRFTDTFVKHNGRWLAIASQGTQLPKRAGT